MENFKKGSKYLINILRIIGIAVSVIRTIVTVISIIQNAKDRNQKSNRPSQR